MERKIIFFGSGDYTIPIIEVLIKHGLAFIVTTEQKGPFINYLKKENIPFISSKLRNDKDIQTILNLKPNIGVLASYGVIIPEFLILNSRPEPSRRAKFLILNIHPSLLPKYKGPSPIQTTILNGDKQTGVTIIKLDKEIDHGPIAQQKTVQLTGNETTEELKNKLFSIGSEMIDKILAKIEKGGEIQFKEQGHLRETFTPLPNATNRFAAKKEVRSRVTGFTSKITRSNGFFDIANPPDKTMLQKMIRAYHPWPGVWTEFPLYGKVRRVKFLPQGKIQVEGKKVMTVQEFLNGYQNQASELLVKLGFDF